MNAAQPALGRPGVPVPLRRWARALSDGLIQGLGGPALRLAIQAELPAQAPATPPALPLKGTAA